MTYRNLSSGTLMAPEVLYRVLFGTSNPQGGEEKRITICPAVLHEYRRHRVKFADFPAITPKRSSTVRGAIITGLSEGDIYRLDSFEGSMYERQKVKVRLLKNVRLEDSVPESSLARVEGEEVEAETYVWKEGFDDLEDREWDFDHFRRRKMKAWMGESDSSTGADTEVDEGFAAADAADTSQARFGSTSRRGTGPRNVADRSAGDQRSSGRVMGDRSASGQILRGRGAGGRGGGGRDAGGRGTVSRSASDQSFSSRGTGGRSAKARGKG